MFMSNLKSRPSFYFWTDRDDVKFTCALQNARCVYRHGGTGKRCRVQINAGLPYCADHLAREKKLAIKPSLLVPGELGLFVECTDSEPGDIVFRPGQRIIEYVGEEITDRELDRRYGQGDTYTAPYALRLKHRIKDAACLRGAAAFANGVARVDDGANAAFHITPMNSLTDPNVFMMHATKRIRNGQEIIVTYGKTYFGDGKPASHHKTVY